MKIAVTSKLEVGEEMRLGFFRRGDYHDSLSVLIYSVIVKCFFHIFISFNSSFWFNRKWKEMENIMEMNGEFWDFY
jgi:hypothetical protein